MDAAAYQSLRDLQDKHWWFVGRREIIAHLIRRFAKLPARPRILEAGCGYGGNIALLEKFGDLDAFEFEDGAREFSAKLAKRPVTFGRLPDKIDYESRSFDMIAMLDVLEHIEEDGASLAALKDRLKVDGSIVITVPALPWLWSHHDEIHHHKRRYSKAELQQTLRDSGFTIESIGYFNSFLFPLALVQRLIKRLTGSGQGVDEMLPGPINALFTKIFAAEQKLLGRFPLPIGLSLYAVARRTV